MTMELSFDLVEEILSRVPATSLARLRYTCKQWKTLIADPRFVDKHLSRMRGLEQQFTIFKQKTSNMSSTLYRVGIDFSELDIPRLNLRVSKPCDSRVISLSHCDGLLLYVTKAKLYVLNPLLNQARWINSGYEDRRYKYGLGYISNQSSSCNDYKIVRFCCARDSRTQVYDFASDSWKVALDETSNRLFDTLTSSVCLRGTPYWIGYDVWSDGAVSLQSFDFLRERFEPLSLPPSSASEMYSDPLCLGVFRGDQLSLLNQSLSTGEVHIWVMKQQHWSKLMKFAKPELLKLGSISNYLIEENNGKVVLSGGLIPSPIRIYVVGKDQECQNIEYCSCTTGRCSCRNRMWGYCSYVPSLLQVPGCSK